MGIHRTLLLRGWVLIYHVRGQNPSGPKVLGPNSTNHLISNSMPTQTTPKLVRNNPHKGIRDLNLNAHNN